MHKVSEIYTRKDKSGFWLRWFENRKRKHKSFLTKDEAKMFRKKKYIELNVDVYGCADMPFVSARDEYLQKYDLQGLSPASKYRAKRVLELFEENCSPRKISDINQRTVDSFIQSRIKALKSPYSVNQAIGRLKAFINWLVKRGYHKGHIDISMMKTVRVVKKALTTEQIKALLKACPTKICYMRILLSLVTGLRASDIDRLPLDIVDLKRSCLDSKSGKTGKTYLDRPLPESLIPALTEYIESLPKNTVKLLPDNNIRKTWDTIRETAGVNCTRQDFRVTHSTLLQKIGGINAAQISLEHSDKRTTTDFYSDIEVIQRWKINQLPVKEWLE
ncbi:MAG TPA: hypothetical protein DDW84_00095 [Phycisphaerales bacterium]|nr:MAG: hypothetical protein A2Y13_02060 [Planctomycetes bacterium GWC2_45_44]HBG77237.1 hypothetical protein [Phycisphaerales bacterium]HBR19206.1 hypothetical protein [Phycisphaerales bacterium]